MQSVLVLSASSEPLNVVSAAKAMKLILNGKAVSVKDSPQVLRSANEDFQIPYVVQLHRMVNKGYRVAPFSTSSVLLRDGYKCAYCNRKATTIDHVVPKSKGGEWSYTNCVAACYKCNNKKGSKSLAELGWKLEFVPKAPSIYEVMLNKYKPNTEHMVAWKPHIELWTSA